jgi:transcriptional regulator with XRE-family HTH domain
MSSKKTSYDDNNPSNRYPEFSSRLLGIVVERNLNNKKFAELIGVSENAATNYLRKGRLPTAEILRRIALAFNISTDWLLQDLLHNSPHEEKNGADQPVVCEETPTLKALEYGDTVSLHQEIVSAFPKDLRDLALLINKNLLELSRIDVPKFWEAAKLIDQVLREARENSSGLPYTGPERRITQRRISDLPIEPDLERRSGKDRRNVD